MTLDPGIIIPKSDAQGRLIVSPDPETATKSIFYIPVVVGPMQAAAGVDTSFDTVLDAAVTREMIGLLLQIGDQAAAGDYVALDVYSPGPGSLVGSFGKFLVLKNLFVDLSEDGRKKDVPANFVLRMIYHSVGASAVDLAANYKILK